MVEGIKDFEFQNECVSFLIQKTIECNSKKIITVKAPTGAGKTVILIKYINEYLDNTVGNTAFIWLCPGKGNLEEQSKQQMEKLTPERDTRNLVYSLLTGFAAGSTTFINWELVTKKGNNSLKDGERQNLFDRIAEAHKSGISFVIIIDEEHANNTSKANDIITAFGAKNIIRVSATAKQGSLQEYYEIPEDDVINAGLITRAIYVNEGVDEKKQITNDYDYLLDLAEEKRKEIAENYRLIGSKVRPLVLIQFPTGQPETIRAVEEKLASMGYTYDNNMVNIWMSDDKMISDDLTDLDGFPAFLLMKQAISTGWDCPRAKILVKLREGGSEEFQIQTVGRIRRMPERKHYGLNILDFCYLYTLDTKYKEGLLSSMDKAYQLRRLFLKDEVKGFTLIKELRNLDYDGLGERETLLRVYDYFKNTYSLTGNRENNRTNLEGAGYNFNEEIDSRVLRGIFRTTEELAKQDAHRQIVMKTQINTHTHGIYLLHAIDEIKRVTGMQSQKVKAILERMFRKGKNTRYKFIALETNAFYAFIINNTQKLKMDFKQVTSQMSVQRSFILEPKTTPFVIPEQDMYKFSEVKKEQEFRFYAYWKYTTAFCTERTRSLPERLFERYCEKNAGVEWFYKNGDAGQQYLSIVYTDGLQKQWLFYPDYIVQKENGETWLIETKGGEVAGHSKNIDMQMGNKFLAFKRYAEEYGLKWGFVRDMDEQLYINNTEFVDDMSDEHWVSIEEVF